MKKLATVTAMILLMCTLTSRAGGPPTPPNPDQGGTDLGGGNQPVPVGTATALLIAMGAGITIVKLRKKD